MNSKRQKMETLSDNISALITSKPCFIEAEEDDLTKIDQLKSNNEDDQASDELELGKFRKLNIELLDADDDKYLGKKVSRKYLQEEEEEDAFGNDSTDFEGSSDDEKPEFLNSDDEDEIEEEESTNSSVDSEEENEDEVMKDSEHDLDLTPQIQNQESEFKSISSSNKLEIEKGNAIRNQIAIWDNLLECRIKFQKCLIQANQLPRHKLFNVFKKDEKFSDLVIENEKTYKNLLIRLLELQDVFINQNPDIEAGVNSSKHRLDEEDDEESSEEGTSKKRRKIEEAISEHYEKVKPFRDQTIQHWNDKTRVNQIKSKDFSGFEQSTLKQIEMVLMDRERLIKRTQLKRSNYQILGEAEKDEGSPSKKQKLVEDQDRNSEIFDDGDFYHQLLRELLERKSNDVTDPVQLGRQWIQLQKLRSKMKRNIDTRATKGRKIRYLVHPKLVNFMMPVPVHDWTDSDTTELFSSLFGKK